MVCCCHHLLHLLLEAAILARSHVPAARQPAHKQGLVAEAAAASHQSCLLHCCVAAECRASERLLQSRQINIKA
jgi:hypothetical protein